MQHVDKLLDDERLRVDTINGRRSVPALGRRIVAADREVELKRLMADLNVPDRELQSRMPVGRSLTVELWKTRLLVFKQNVGRIKVLSIAPTRALLKGEKPEPMKTAELRSLLTQLSQAEGPGGDAPTTLVILATHGFELEAREVSDRRADRTLILVEPNESGGWNAFGPNETQALVDLFDPEAEETKRQRVRDEIAAHEAEIVSGGLSAERIAGATRLSLHLVESEAKSYARQRGGLVAKRLDGKMVLFREGNVPAQASAGGADMPFMQRVKSIFARKGDTEKKIALLSERRAALTMQRDSAHDEMASVERKETDLRDQFKATSSDAAKRRLTSQMLQLRKDLERRQQLLGVLNQQINIIGTHLHNLELVQQGSSAKLPDSEELATDAAAAEEVLAELQADSEIAGSISTLTASGMTDEEQALFEELEAESKAENAAAPDAANPARPESTRQPTRPDSAAYNEPPPLPRERQREPEAG